MNELMSWISKQPVAEGFLRKNLTRVPGTDEPIVPSYWQTATAGKISVLQFPENFGPDKDLKPANSTALGGMCLINTPDMKAMSRKEIGFSTIKEFETWYRSWYPRIDQVHDAVGAPPNGGTKVLYVTEDSLFAQRIGAYTGLDKGNVQRVLHDVHESQGHPAVVKYLKGQGFKGEVKAVYTSEVEEGLEVALRMWERMMNKSPTQKGDRNFAKVELMYTGFWLDILKLQTPGVIFEAANKMVLKGYLKLEEWFKANPYGTGVNSNLGIAGYVPFLTTRGEGADSSHSQVPNRGNHESFAIPDDDMPWYIANLLSAKKSVVENGPSAVPSDQAREMIKSDLAQIYS